MTQPISESTTWQALASLPPEFPEHPRQVVAGGLMLDFTTAGYGQHTFELLQMLAEESNWQAARDAMLEGKIVNPTEQRPALHHLLRARREDILPDYKADVDAGHVALRKCLHTAQTLGAIDVIHVGLGGSGLGPLFLRSFFQGFSGSNYRLHIIVNADPSTVQRIKQTCDPKKTIVSIASKSFTTEETMAVAHELKSWLGDLRRMFAITGKPDIAKSFGVPPDNIMPLPDWLGGRFSLWGCITFPIILTFGPQLVDQLLHGARLMDEHFATAPAEQNAPLQLALAHLWQRNFMGCEAHAIIPYADALRHLPAYIQQLEMESNGKPAAVPTVPVIFGGVGTTVQHSFMQWFHQSQSMASCDLISVDKLPGSEELSLLLRRNVLAQSSALAHGAPPVCPGGRPSNMIFVPELSATTLGALMALYEHKVMLAAHFWGINAFDQPGVELSKQLARQIEKGEVPRSTAPRLERYK